MPIIVTCDCGKKLKVGDQHAGKKVQCPGCNEVIPVPEAEAEDRGADRFAAALKSGPMSGRRKPPVEDDEDTDERSRPVRKRRGEEDEDEDRPSRKSSRVDDDEEEQEEERPRRKKKSRRKPETTIAGAGALIAGGSIMMIGAAIWFIVGLLNDWLFYYPPVLFVIGLVTLIRGMMGYSD